MKKKLSKTHIKAGLQCRLMLHRLFNKTIEPNYKDVEGLLEKGNQINNALHSMIKGVVINNPDNYQKILITQDVLKSGAEHIFEATFQTDELIIQVDYLRKNSDGTYDIIEVKSSSSSASSIKKMYSHYVEDVAIQLNAVSKHIKVRSCHVWVINKDYVYDGKEHNLDLFFKMDVSEDVKKVEERIQRNIENARLIVSGVEPTVEISSHCKKPYDCPFKDVCWKAIKQTDMYKIPRLRKKPELFNEGIVSAFDEYFNTKGDKLAVESLRAGKMIVRERLLKGYLEEINSHSKIDFLDFEGMNHPLPIWKGTTPYERIPFQYSMHRRENGKLTHKEFLASGKINPARELADKLAEDLKDSEIILVYFQTYEIGILKYLAEKYPEHAEVFLSSIGKIVDLFKVVKDCIYSPEFKGSLSIKTVGPTLIGDKANWTGEITNGQMAADMYAESISLPDEDRERVFKELLIYCGQDTMNLVHILDWITDYFNE